MRRAARACGALLTMLGVLLVGTGPARAEELPATTHYTVRAGDTCAEIAKRTYGDARFVDLIHEANPSMGRPPHALRPGLVLLLPPKPGAAPSGPDAHVTWLRNQVEVRTPEPRPAKKDDPLRRGNQVETKASSAADITFRDETQLKLNESTLIVVLGDANANASRVAAAETTLVTGGLRSRLSELAGKHDVRSGGGAVASLKPGEAQVSVDEKRTTRLAVYKGEGSLTAASRSVTVPGGFGSMAPSGAAPTPPRPLPEAPSWTSQARRVVIASGAAPTLAFAFAAAAPSTAPPPAQWHVQLARDAEFHDIVADAIVGRSVDRIQTENASHGGYWARVSAFDDDLFEGKWSAVAHAVVVDASATNLPGRRSQVSIAPAADVRCAVDGAPPLGGVSFELDRSRQARTLRCSAKSAGDAVGSLTFERLPLETIDAVATVSGGRLSVRLRGAIGEPIEDVEVSGHGAPAGVHLGAFHAVAGDPSRYEASLTYDADAHSGPVTLRIVERGRTSHPPVLVATTPLPPPPKRERTTFALAASGRFVAIRATQGGALGVGIDAAASVPLRNGRLLVDLGGAADRVLIADGETTEGRDIARARGNIWNGHLLGGYRLGASDALLAPYGLVGPAVALHDTRVRQAGRRVEGSAIALGIAAALGLELRTSARSAVFAELGGRLVTELDVDGATFNATAATFALGHRFFALPGLR